MIPSSSDYLKIIYARVNATANNLKLNLLLGDISNLWPQVFPSSYNYVALYIDDNNYNNITGM